MSGKAPKVAVAKKASVAVPESQLKKRKTVDALKAKQAANKVGAAAGCSSGSQRRVQAQSRRLSQRMRMGVHSLAPYLLVIA